MDMDMDGKFHIRGKPDKWAIKSVPFLFCSSFDKC